MRRGNVLPIAVMAFAIVAFLFIVDYSISGGKWPWSTNSARPSKVAVCTQEAKLCPDGSFVSRTGPACAFAACPVANTPIDVQAPEISTTTTNANVQIETNTNAPRVSVSTEDDGTPLAETREEGNSTNPVKHVETITQLFAHMPDEGFRKVNIMGDKALIAGGKYLYLYDHRSGTVTDLTSHFTSSDPATEAKILIPNEIANNGQYWMLGNTRVGETAHLYTFDGTTWNDLTSQLLTAVPNTITGGLNFAWNGSYWLIGHNPGHLVKYDGQTFTDLFSQIPNPEHNVTIMDIAWNGSYFLFTMLGPANHGRLYRYDGATFTQLTDVSADSYVTNITWNGTLWLISGFNGQHLLTYDGKKFADTGVGTRQQAVTAWVKNRWLISGQQFDGQTLDPIPTVLGGFDMSIGNHFGIALNYQSVQKFDF